MTTTTDNRSHRHRGTALTGVLAAVAVAGGLAASPSAAVQTASAASSASNDVVLRPDGDVRAFAVTKGASAASVLDDAVTSRSRVPRGDAIRAAVAGATTTVTLGGRIRSGLRPTGARAWFFAGTGSGTSLRVEVVSRDGVVLAGTTVKPRQGAKWASVSFRPANRAALKGLTMRFVAVGGDQAEVRAAYASVTSRTGRGATLRPARVTD